MGRSLLQTKTDATGALYVQPKHIADSLSISRTTVWRLLKAMKQIPKYKKSFLDLGWQLKLVKLSDFEKFLQEQEHEYLKKAKG